MALKLFFFSFSGRFVTIYTACTVNFDKVATVNWDSTHHNAISGDHIHVLAALPTHVGPLIPHYGEHCPLASGASLSKLAVSHTQCALYSNFQVGR